MNYTDDRERGSDEQYQGIVMKKGWQTKKLGEICTVDWGNTDLTKSAYVEGGKFLAVSAAGCDGRIGHKEHEKYTPVLSAIGAQCGRMFLPEEDFTAIKNTITLTPREGTCTGRFLYQLLTHVELPRRGAAQPFISKGDIEAFQVPVPPLPEQQRIVALLDEAFAGLAIAKANAEQNLQNARTLFESHLQSVFSQRGDGWVECPLDELTEPDSPITYGVVKPGPEGEIRFVRGGDLVSGKVRLTQLRTITREVSDQYRRTLLRGGELLICLVGQPGQVGIAPTELAGANIARQVGLIRLSKKINAEFVRFFLQSAQGAEALGARESGSVQQVINLGELRQVAIPYPDFSEQVDIVARLNLVDAETQHLTRLYERKLAALEELKKSLLHQAVNGEL
jgi:type I restriction enzyme S subunit